MTLPVSRPRLQAPRVLRFLAVWIPAGALVGVLAGIASAVLLVSLTWATDVREAHRWLIALLPMAGFAVGAVYEQMGDAVERGTSLIVDEIHDPRQTIPLRMTPLILTGTIVTHLFGGSAGREGTAVQMGASLADGLGARFLPGDATSLGARRRMLLMAGISGGFASVFGTPFAGAVFGLEVLRTRRLAWPAIVPCAVAAFAGDLTVHALHVQHTAYPHPSRPDSLLKALALAAVAGVAFGLTARVFAAGLHRVAKLFRRVRRAPLRPAIGGAMVAAAVFALGSTRYIGLGIPAILEAFGAPHRPWDFAAKLLFTVVTLGSGFKGGEVTPLFFIGATLGNALAYVLPLPAGMLAALGFAAVFGGASKTPVASTLMAMELFGGQMGLYAAAACAVSWLCSGEPGLYGARR